MLLGEVPLLGEECGLRLDQDLLLLFRPRPQGAFRLFLPDDLQDEAFDRLY